MEKITHIAIDVSKPNTPAPVYAKQGDTARVIAAKLMDSGAAYTIPTGAVAIMRAGKPDGTGCFYDDGITISGNEITIPLVEQVLTVAGTVYAEVNLYNSSGDKLTSFSWQIAVQKTVLADTTIISSDYFNALTATAAQILTAGMKIQVLGYYADLTALEAAVTNPNAGDVYGLTDDANYDFVIYDGIGETWRNAGTIQGATGPQGIPGTDGTDGTDGTNGIDGTGNNWYTGNAITGTSTTPTAYATGIEDAQVGDHYLNNGALPNTGRDYVCTLGGNAATALWKYNALLRGSDGSGIGDMLKSTYDSDSDGIVDDSERLGGQLPSYYAKASDVPDNADFTLNGLSEKSYNNLTDKPTIPNPVIDLTATLTTSWTGSSAPYTQTISGLTGVTANSKLEVGLAETATDAQYTAAVAAQIRATDSGAGTVTFKAHGTKPTVALPIIVRVVS